MADEYEDEYYDESYGSPYGGQAPLAIVGMSNQYTTPEALEYARKILGRTIDQDDESEEDMYMESVRKRADTVREALRQAREKIAAQEYGHQDFWLAAAQAFGSPTKTGAIGETFGNVAGNLREPLAKRRSFNQARDKSLLDIDLGLAGVDEDLLKAQLELMKMRNTRDTTLSKEALGILGRRVGDSTKLQNQATAAVDREMAKDYVDFIQTGASDAAKALEELGMARDELRGFTIDPETGERKELKKNDNLTGPVVGTLSNLPWIGKTVQDVAFPESSDVQETVEYTVQRSLRPILGSQFTKEEGERLIARVYNPRLKEEVNAARLDRLIKQLQRAYDAKVAASRYFERNGTMRGFRGKLRWTVDDIWTPEDDAFGKPREMSEEEEAIDEPLPFPSVEEEPVLQYEDIIPAGEGYAKGGKVGNVLKVIKGGLKTKPFDFEIYRSVSEDNGNFDATQAKKWSKAEILDYLADELEETGLDRSLAKRFKVTQQPHFLEFDSNNPSHAAGYWQARVDGPADLVDQIDARWEAEDAETYGDNAPVEIENIDEIDPPEEFAEGGAVDSERIPHRMPDGRVIEAPPGVPYARVLQRYSQVTGQTFEEPSQEELAEEPMEEEVSEEIVGFDPSVPDAIGLGGSAVGHGLLGAMGGRYGVKTAHGLADLIPGHRASGAETRVLSGLENEGLPPGELVKLVQKAQRLGVPATAMDLGGIELRALGEASMNPRNPETRDFYQTLLARQAGSRGRVEDQINKALKPDDYFQTQKKLKRDLQTNAKPLYAELYKKYPSMKSESLMQLLETPSGKKAVKNAARAIRDRPGATLGKQDAMGMVTKPSLEFLDQVKDEFDDMISKEEMKGGVYKATKRGKRLRELRNALRNEVDALTTDPKTQVSAYKEARSQYAGDLEIMDALRFGREEFLRLPTGEIEQALGDMNFSEKDALRTGVAQALFERVGKVGKRVNPADKVIDTPEMQEKLKLLFDKPNEYKIFKEALDLESRMFDESQSTIRKGRSALSTTRDPKDNILRRTAKKAPTLGVFSPTQWAIRWLRRSEAVKPKEAAEIIRILRSSDPKELAKLEKKLGPKYGREVKRKGRVGKATAAGAAIGALAPLYNKYFGDDEEEEQEFARGGLVRKRRPDWQTVTEQILETLR